MLEQVMQGLGEDSAVTATSRQLHNGPSLDSGRSIQARLAPLKESWCEPQRHMGGTARQLFLSPFNIGHFM